MDLGKRFILRVEAALDSIRGAPTRWPVLEQDVRRHLIKVFPYAVLYTPEADHILILAIWKWLLRKALESNQDV